MTVLGVINIILFIILLFVLAYRVYVYNLGDVDVKFADAAKSPLKAVRQDEKTVVLRSAVEMANQGKQIAVIIDCFTRHLLPYEQFDGVKAASRVMREDAPREDDYFEAYLLKQNTKINLIVEFSLTARKDETIKDALSRMVDLPVEIHYQMETRNGLFHKKLRLEFTAQEIAAAAGATLQED
jgi:hypothetical protein